MRYKNYSLATKTFYGVTFRPGEEHDVPGIIHDPKFFKVPDVPHKEDKVEYKTKQVKQLKPVDNTVEQEIIKQEVTPDGEHNDQ